MSSRRDYIRHMAFDEFLQDCPRCDLSLYHLISACFFTVKQFDFYTDFPYIVIGSYVEKRSFGCRMQMAALALS